MRKRMPLVSILIPNFNHSRYLDECIQSCLAQTYQPVEIILLDNQSTDTSVEIALRYRKDGVRVCRNVNNLYNLSYIMLSTQLANGEYYLLMGADDAIHPTFVEKAVGIMRAHPDVGYVHGERDFVFENGELLELDPFFNCSFVAPGESVMPLYMVTTIAHPAQGIFKRSAFERIGGYEMEIDHLNADKSLWFYLSSTSDYGYIREKMCRIRVSQGNETFVGQRNFHHPLLCHLLIKDFVRFAKQFGYPAVVAREGEAMARLAGDFLVFAGAMLLDRDYANAKAYLLYAQILQREIVDTKPWRRLMAMHDSQTPDPEYIASQNVMYTKRKRGYAPPEGFEAIDLEKVCL